MLEMDPETIAANPKVRGSGAGVFLEVEIQIILLVIYSNVDALFIRG